MGLPQLRRRVRAPRLSMPWQQRALAPPVQQRVHRHQAMAVVDAHAEVNFERMHADKLHQPPSGQHGLPTAGLCVAGATPAVDNPAPMLIET